MKIIILLILLNCISVVEAVNWTYMQSQNADLLQLEVAVSEGRFDQQVDHFNGLKSSVTFKQRYYEKKYGDGPLFLFIGGESPIGPWCMWDQGMFATMASNFKAHAFCLEHRHYGVSVPHSLDTNELGALNVHQALADIAYFVESKKDHPNQEVIVFGCSYPGSLAAWSRAQYPALITGAISSSAPLKAVRKYVEFDEWISKAVGKECQTDILNATSGIETMLDENFKSTTLLLECPRANTLAGKPFATESILHVIAESIVYPVQYDDPSVSGRDTLRIMCDRFKNARMSAFRKRSLNDVREKNKNEVGKKRVESSESVQSALVDALIENVKWVSKKMGISCDNQNFFLMTEENSRPHTQKHVFLRAWNYQCCDSFGFWQVASNKSKSTRSQRLQMDFYDASCNAAFKRPDGTSWNSTYAETSTNAQLGAFNIINDNGASNIHFTNGEIDPWASLSINTIPSWISSSSTSFRHITAHVIPNGSHCTDFSAPRTKEIREAHAKIKAAITTYLNKSFVSRKDIDNKHEL